MVGITIAGRMPAGGLWQLADDKDDEAIRRSISRQVRGVIVGTALLLAIFLTATAHAVLVIDDSSIARDRHRAEAAAAFLVTNHRAISDAAVRRVGETFDLAGARLARRGEVGRAELSVPLSRDTVLAFTPRRLGSETFVQIAPFRIPVGFGVILGITLVLHRLHALARHTDARRLAARNLAGLDPLTGLGNRLTFNQELARRIGVAAAGRERTALLLLDLNGFKAVNDRLGHLAGDRLLEEVATRLRAHAAPGDAVARLGGDEFAFLRQEGLTPHELASFAEELVMLIGAPYRIDGQTATVTVSIGIACIDDETHESEALIRAADAALYRAKARPGGAYELHAPTPATSFREQSAA